jgi:hypothetical protein
MGGCFSTFEINCAQVDSVLSSALSTHNYYFRLIEKTTKVVTLGYHNLIGKKPGRDGNSLEVFREIVGQNERGLLHQRYRSIIT